MTVAEALVALILGSAVTAAAWGVAVQHAGVVERMEHRSRALEAVQTAALVLDWELLGGDAGSPAGDELPLRAWRGWGRVCARPAGGAAVVWEGLRAPDPARDSLLVVLDDGARLVVALTGQRRGVHGIGAHGCPGDEIRTLRWRADALPPGSVPVWTRAFERGAYRIGDALRYRRGRGGAQPLTEALLDPDLSAWHDGDVSGVRLVAEDAGGAAVERRW